MSFTNTDITITVPANELEDFKTLVRRGINTWYTAPVHIKEFADLVTEGKITQDYRAAEQTGKFLPKST